MTSISLIIPTWQAAPHLRGLVGALRSQSLLPTEIIVVDSSSPDGTAQIAASLRCKVIVIPQVEFRHGGTRNLAALQAQHDLLVFMTQDVMPAGPEFLFRLVAPIMQQLAAATYARQLPRPGAGPLEAFDRAFHYPPPGAGVGTSKVRQFYFSNAASAVARSAFFAVGGFPPEAPAGEDRLLSVKLQAAGLKVRYAAEAEVVHSHLLSLDDCVRRYFDFGAAAALARQHKGTDGLVGEGRMYSRTLFRHLVVTGQVRLVPLAVRQLGAKVLGYWLGTRYRWLPLGLRSRLGTSAWCRQAFPQWQLSDSRFQSVPAAAARAAAGQR